MRRNLGVITLLLVCLSFQNTHQAKKQKTAVVSDINDLKEFKRLLKTKTNILVLFMNMPKQSKSVSDVFRETADLMKGQATLVSIDCSAGESKKLCKKLKVGTEKPYYIKHYKDGDFHKDYDRSESLNSMANFLRDPTGDLPWDEDPQASDIYHLQDGEALSRFLKKGAAVFKKSLVMFYAPWCGFCKSMKPDYVLAAKDLKGEALLAAIDVAKPGNSKVRQQYNITGFPTLLYYEKGQYRMSYNGDNKREAIVSFVRDPLAQVQQKEPADESWSQDNDVVHLTGETFDKVVTKAEHALVVFYAPWCGHCKRIKPELEKAATRVKTQGIKGVLAAVDATKHPALASRFAVKGYPTLKYFYKGEFKFDAGHARSEDQIVNFIKDPQEPPPPPPPEQPWAEEESSVRHLNAATIKSKLRKIKHALVMFYAPWCGHCKTTKPEFVKAAEEFADELLVAFGAVDCTTEQDVCAQYDIKAYPTIKYFSHYDKKVDEYRGGRKQSDFVSFMNSHLGRQRFSQQSLPTAQEAGFGVNVQLANDDSFDTIINVPSPVFVMFYASWCGHCVAVKPAFSKLATQLKNEGSGIKVIAVDAAENPKVADFAGIQNLPTLKMYIGGAHVDDYEGDRSFEDLLRFVRQAKLNDEL